MSLVALLTTSAVADLAGPRSYARGLDYSVDGRVTITALDATSASARVAGSRSYDIRLDATDGRVRSSCSCPMGAQGHFCKHCVATALAVMVGGSSKVESGRSEATAVTDDELRDHLVAVGTDHLADLVMEQVKQNWKLRDRLATELIAAQQRPVDTDEWRRRIEFVLLPEEYVDYHDAYDWARDVDDVIDAVEQLLDVGYAEAVVELAEFGCQTAEAAAQFVDDSDGWITGFFERFASVHLQAVGLVRPDPVALARRLVEVELSSDYGVFANAAAVYAEVLGPIGLAEYRRIIEERWEAAPPGGGEQYSSGAFNLRSARVGLARGSGDVDELIVVLSEKGLAAADYLEIVRELREADRTDEALEWARRGHDAFYERPWQGGDLRDVLAELLWLRGDADQAIDLYWTEFTDRPTLSSYLRYREEVQGIGDDDGGPDQAIEWLRAHVSGPDGDVVIGEGVAGPASTLVEALMAEERTDEAWTVAIDHGCANDVWLKLADQRGPSHPLEVIPVLVRAARRAVEGRNKDAYRLVVAHLGSVRDLAGAADRPDLFDDAVAWARADHKRKRNLMAMIDARGW